MLVVFAIISAILVIASMPPYIIDTIRGKAKPERASWAIWTALEIIAFFSTVKLGVTLSLVFIGIDGLGNLIIFGLALKKGTWGWTRLDKIAIAIAAVGLILSFVLRQPILALLGVILADASGTVLTIVKTLKDPKSETYPMWFLVGSASVFSALAVGKLDASLLIYPIYLVLANYTVIAAKYIGASSKVSLRS